MKKVFIGVLAALMLFAFTACDNQMGYKTPVGISAVASQTEYLEGETFDPSTVSIVVDYSDGSSRTMTGAEAGLATAVIEEGANTYTVSYGVQTQYTSAPETMITVMGYKADSAVISNLPTAGTLKDGKVNLDYSATTVTVSYNNGKTRTLEAGEYTIEPTIDASEGKKTVSAVKLTVFEQPVTAVTTTPATWEVTVSAAPVEEGEFGTAKSIDIKYTDAKGNDITSSIANGTFYVDDVINWEVYLVDEDGNTKVATENTDYWFANGKKPASKSVTLGATEVKAEKATTYSIVPLVGDAETLTIPVAKDYVYAITAINPKTDSSAPSIGTANASNYLFTVRMGSDKTKDATPVDGSNLATAGFTATILDPDIPVEGVEGYAPRFALTWGKPNADGTLPMSGERKANPVTAE